MKGADRDGCLTPHSEDHCDEDYDAVIINVNSA